MCITIFHLINNKFFQNLKILGKSIILNNEFTMSDLFTFTIYNSMFPELRFDKKVVLSYKEIIKVVS